MQNSLDSSFPPSENRNYHCSFPAFPLEAVCPPGGLGQWDRREQGLFQVPPVGSWNPRACFGKLSLLQRLVSSNWGKQPLAGRAHREPCNRQLHSFVSSSGGKQALQTPSTAVRLEKQVIIGTMSEKQVIIFQSCNPTALPSMALS